MLTCDVKAVARLLLYGAGINITPCPLLLYPEDQSKEVIKPLFLDLLFLASTHDVCYFPVCLWNVSSVFASIGLHTFVSAYPSFGPDL